MEANNNVMEALQQMIGLIQNELKQIQVHDILNLFIDTSK